MKKLLLLFIAGLSLLNYHGNAQEPSHSKNIYSDIFTIYSKKFDTIIVYSINSNRENLSPFKIIGAKKGEWYSIEYYKREVLLKKDSVIKKFFKGCKNSFVEILNNNLLSIPDESKILSDCKKISDTMINGRTVAGINDLNAISDLEVHILEYKIANQKRRISYRSPDYALKICPESKERIAISKIISIINSIN